MSLLTKNIFYMSTSQNVHNAPMVKTVYKYLGPSIIINQIRNYAARKGTRDKRKKQKVKVQEKKVEFVPHNERDKEKFLLMRKTRKFDDSWKRIPTDDVYQHKYYQWKVYDFVEAVECHRETHHPEMCNVPNANLHLTVELNMAAEKKNRFIDNFSKIAPIKYKFDHGQERAILAFSKDQAMIEEVQKAGALLSGGAELIKDIQSGKIALHDFQFVLAHPNILPELVVLRGLLKKKFPNIRNGTLEVNLAEAVDNFKTGIQYTAVKDDYEKDFGSIDTIIGTLNMEPKHLEENFATLINNVYSFKPKRGGSFITRCMLWSPPSGEKFKVDHNVYIKQTKGNTKPVDDDAEATGELAEEETQLKTAVVT